MSAPEVITEQMLFAAGDNHAAVERVREWCDKTEAAASGDQSESVFQARMGLVDEVRRLLPETTS